MDSGYSKDKRLQSSLQSEYAPKSKANPKCFFLYKSSTTIGNSKTTLHKNKATNIYYGCRGICPPALCRVLHMICIPPQEACHCNDSAVYSKPLSGSCDSPMHCGDPGLCSVKPFIHINAENKASLLTPFVIVVHEIAP